MDMIYVHHNYSYERFWYFFHGTDVDIEDVPTHVDVDSAFNPHQPITSVVTIPIRYQTKSTQIIFVGDNSWTEPGHHLFDYSIWLYDTKQASDRGFNSNIMKVIDEYLIPKFNKLALTPNTLYHFLYLDWEGHHAYVHHSMSKKLNSKIQVYVDEVPVFVNHPNCHFVFTNTFMSFIYPNTLGLREYYFMGKFLKNRKFKHKMNFPIRRLYGNKIKFYNKVKDLKNINITHSSFHDTKQYSNDQVGGWRSTLIADIKSENVIEKRGYGIYDWGGEWNDDNVKEMMWRLFDIAEVNIIPEYSVKEAIQNLPKPEYDIAKHKVGTSYMTEKSVSHILMGKPFIPISYETIDFYTNILTNRGKSLPDYPLQYLHLHDIIDEIDKLADDELKWKDLVCKLTEWVTAVRMAIIECVDSENDLLQILFKTEISNENSSLI